MGKWVRTKTEVRVDGVYDPMLVADDLAAFGYEEERIPVTILPTEDADEALRLLEEAERHLQEALETYQGEEWQASAIDVARPLTAIRAFLAKVKG